MIAEPDLHDAGWRADLRLRFAARGAQTHLVERSHLGPLIVQRPFYPEEGVCHVYVLHPPGGVVGGDALSIRVNAEHGTNVLLTTPAAAKFYRSQGAIARQDQSIDIAGACVEWLPQESIFFSGARVRSTTRVRVKGASRFIGWEIACLGLPARSDDFEAGALQLGFELEVEGVPRVIDRLRIEGDSVAPTAVWGLNGCRAIGTLLAYPATRVLIERVREYVPQDVEMALSLVDDVLVCRALGQQAEPVRGALTRIWTISRPALMNRESLVPRIWRT
ncbi:MAG: urease accessory protein UreD [Xanthomonadaceae bacterium]|nr:urease accessory protein UreD [Xanthomonadaceae bacterium]